jgi:hypothetical protein
MRTEVWKVDPERAAELLASVRYNRPISPLTVGRYARTMLAGRWRLTGSGISVVENGDGSTHMINGAHRMQAVIKSGVTQEFLVIWEEDESVFETFDIGRTRSTATLLGLAGHHSPAVVAAMVRVLLLYKQTPDVLWTSARSTVAPDDVLRWVAELGPEGQDLLADAARRVNELRRSIRTVGSWYGSLVWLIQTEAAQPDLFLEFHEALRAGAGLPSGDTRLAYRNYIINTSPGSLRDATGDMARQAYLAVGIRAWNDWMKGEERQQYKFQAGRLRGGKRINSSLPMPTIR